MQLASPVEFVPFQTDKVDAEQRRPSLVKVGADGQEQQSYRLPYEELQRLGDLFERFKKMGLPNGRY